MRAALAILLAACAVALLGAEAAEAYRLQPSRWHSRTLTYYDATGIYRAEVKAAAQAWNRSGARVRLKAVPRRSARVIVRLDRRLASSARAEYPVGSGGIVTRAVVRLRHDLAKVFSSPVEARAGIAAVIAHELGHVLGLDHEDRRCATMNSSLWARCRRAAELWRHHCRTLEADDVRGLIRRYGGRLRGTGPEFCDSVAAPPAPAALTVTPDPVLGTVRLSWRMPAGPVERVSVLRRLGACPTGPEDPDAQVILEREAATGAAESVEDLPSAPGSHCYAVLAVAPLGRPGGPAFATYVKVGEAPRADFDGYSDGPLRIVFADGSYDVDGRVVAWRWDFGDRTSSSEQSPVHDYPAAGVYTVTLTVTDDSGLTGSRTQTVRVG